MSHDPWVPDLDLGLGRSLIWVTWGPDLGLNPQYLTVPPLRNGEHYGAIIRHPAGPKVGQWAVDYLGPGVCEGSVIFDTPTNRKLAALGGGTSPIWQVHSWEPLTISPSVACDCGEHGFITQGRWVPA